MPTHLNSAAAGLLLAAALNPALVCAQDVAAEYESVLTTLAKKGDYSDGAGPAVALAQGVRAAVNLLGTSRAPR